MKNQIKFPRTQEDAVAAANEDLAWAELEAEKGEPGKKDMGGIAVNAAAEGPLEDITKLPTVEEAQDEMTKYPRTQGDEVAAKNTEVAELEEAFKAPAATDRNIEQKTK